MRTSLRLAGVLLWGALRDQPVKWAISTLAIAVGVGLGLAIHLIHKQALDQFESGVRQFSGQADLQLLPHSRQLPESVLDQLPGLSGLAVFSPVIDLQVHVPGLKVPVRWLGLDVFKAVAVTPQWIGQSDPASATGSSPEPTPNSLLASDTAFLSPALRQELNTSDFETLGADQQSWRWRVAGSLPAAGTRQRVVVSDIAAAQWKLGTLGQISRVDIKLREGVSVTEFKARHAALFAPLGRLETPSEQGSRGASVSQAYRANLSILAMVALLTGGFLSFSTQMLAVAQRARQWALLASLGMKPRSVGRQIAFESLSCGLLGSVLGLALGYGLAVLILTQLGTDLGAGYFQETQVGLGLPWADALLFMGFGLLATGLGAIWPAQQAGRLALQSRLRAGSEESGLHFLNRSHWVGATLVLLSLLCLLIPAYDNIPVGAYLSVAFGLFGGIALIGGVVRLVIRPGSELGHLSQLAQSRLASTPNLLAVGLSGVVASFALVVAMHIMIFSFRQSLDDWLVQVLPAPLYMRVAEGSALSGIPPDLQAKLSQSTAFSDLQFWGQEKLILDSTRPAVELIIRPISLDKAATVLPMTGRFLQADEIRQALAAQPQQVPVWVSEPMTDLYALRSGDVMPLRLDGGLQIEALVAGVWRDYARQHGAIVVPQDVLQNRHGFSIPKRQAAAWPAAGVSIQQLIELVNRESAALGHDGVLQMSQPGDIRQLSLNIFDRSFAVTYLLEVAAVVIGLFGVGTTFSAMALQRKREFALLGALGGKRRLILKLVVQEGLMASGIAAGVGMVMGLAFAAILIFVVNPQSFHWTMQWFTPWRDMALMTVALLTAGTLTVAASVYRSAGRGVLSQLKEDWS